MAKNKGRNFEQQIEESFDAYAEAHIAILTPMPVPTRVIGRKPGTGQVLRVATGKAPWDVVGYLIGDGRIIGAELKRNDQPQSSLKLVAPLKKGDGLQYHQLLALNDVAECGGVARLVWDNGGRMGIIGNEQIRNIHEAYTHALLAEQSGRKPQIGAKSIPADMFHPIDFGVVGGKLVIDWLQPGL